MVWSKNPFQVYRCHFKDPYWLQEAFHQLLVICLHRERDEIPRIYCMSSALVMTCLEFMVSAIMMLRREGSVRASRFVLSQCEFSGMKPTGTPQAQRFPSFLCFNYKKLSWFQLQVAKLMAQFFPILGEKFLGVFFFSYSSYFEYQ